MQCPVHVSFDTRDQQPLNVEAYLYNFGVYTYFLFYAKLSQLACSGISISGGMAQQLYV